MNASRAQEALSAFLASLLLLAGSGCRREQGSGYYGSTARVGKDLRTLYVNNGSEPEYLDPAKSADASSSVLVMHLFEGLTEYDAKDAHPVPAGATHWEQTDDSRLFRFYLRKDAKWSDGRPVTARDYEYSWKRALLPKLASQSAPILYAIKNAEAVNKGSLKSTSRDIFIREGADPSSAPVGRLSIGSPVEVLLGARQKLLLGIDPLPEQGKASPIRFEPPEGNAEGKLVLPDGSIWAGKALPGEVELLGARGPVVCNDVETHWFEIRTRGKQGLVPGCLLEEVKSEPRRVLVRSFTDLPTFRQESGESKPKRDEPLMGFVSEADLETDPSVVGVRATSDLTLEVELSRPTPYFTDLTCYSVFKPVRQDVVEPFEKRGEAELWVRPENIVTNGAYTFDEWKFRYEITMKKNPHYWGRDRLKIDRIVWLEVEEYNPSLNLFKGSEMDYFGDTVALPADYMEFLSTKKEFSRSNWLATYWYEFNTRIPPLDNALVRQALNLAVDKGLIVAKIARGGQVPATHFVPDFVGLGYSEAVQEDRMKGADPFASSEFAFNPERARELLRQAGYEIVLEDGEYRANKFPALEILYNTSEAHKQLAVAIQDMWKRHLGITVTLRNEEWKVLLKNIRQGNFQIVRFGWIADYNHPQTWMETFLSGSLQNYTGWSDPELDALVSKAVRTPDRKESMRLYRLAELRAARSAPRLPLYFYTRSTLVKPWLKGFFPNARNVHHAKWFHIDENWQSNTNNEPAWPSEEFPTPGKY